MHLLRSHRFAQTLTADSSSLSSNALSIVVADEKATNNRLRLPTRLAKYRSDLALLCYLLLLFDDFVRGMFAAAAVAAAPAAGREFPRAACVSGRVLHVYFLGELKSRGFLHPGHAERAVSDAAGELLALLCVCPFCVSGENRVHCTGARHKPIPHAGRLRE